MTGNPGWKALMLLLCGLAVASPSHAARESKISATKHNLSASGTGSTKSTTESQICVFCHTPHGADTSVSPLWNKTITNKTYTLYTSSSLDATQIAGRSAEQPMGSSKLCLSCHDGAMALGSVKVLRGKTTDTLGNPIVIGGGTEVTMPTGSGVTTGFTRNLGGSNNLDLSNDHPISVTYDSTLSTRDGEMRNNNGTNQSWGTVLGKRVKGGTKFLLPLEPTGSISGSEGQVQCTTCHDPHIRDNSAAEGNIKFLRSNRFQKAQPTASYSASNDIICLACHDKGMQGNGNSWAYSAHANQYVATQTYSDAASNTREFPLAAVTGTSNIRVWQAACLNCHDTHTITGANKLLREGASGGAPALEQTCYQCHSTTGAVTLTSNATVPNIGTAFGLTYRMPIVTADQGTTAAPSSEVHAIGNNFNVSYVDCSSVSNKCGADGVEDPVKLGRTASNRHAECADCHNPHRVVKFNLFSGKTGNGDLTSTTPDSSGAHRHTDTAMTHTNVASGVLRGTTGVEPSYPNNSFHSSANNYTVRRGDPSNDSVTNDSNPDTKTYVTREYQVCLKCHSTYGYTTPPALRAAGQTRGLTAAGTNGLNTYTDQAKEFQAPTTHMGEATSSVALDMGTDGGAHSSYNTNNHRSWHPVMRKTGRTYALRGIAAAFRPGGTAPSTIPWRSPWSPDASVGTQTMYCSDCHGSNTGTTTVIPGTTAPPTPWGPHGSENPFILKGVWTKDVGKSTTSNGLCFKCHDYSTYAQGKSVDSGRGCNDSTKIGKTGFGNSTEDLHCKHNELIGKPKDLQCSWCHVAIPHGWKNKAFLVNLNDVGAEVGKSAGSIVSIGGNGDYFTKEPYYLNAKLKVKSFARSGNWSGSNCGNNGTQTINSATDPGTGAAAGGSNNTNSDTNWMTSTCSNPTN